MRVAIIGSRKYTHLAKVTKFVKRLAKSDPTTIIVSGGAVGVDQAAENAAREMGLRYEIYKPDFPPGAPRHVVTAAIWDRNRKIIEVADLVVGFWDGKSPGTKGTLKLALEAGKKAVRIIE